MSFSTKLSKFILQKVNSAHSICSNISTLLISCIFQTNHFFFTLPSSLPNSTELLQTTFNTRNKNAQLGNFQNHNFFLISPVTCDVSFTSILFPSGFVLLFLLSLHDSKCYGTVSATPKLRIIYSYLKRAKKGIHNNVAWYTAHEEFNI